MGFPGGVGRKLVSVQADALRNACRGCGQLVYAAVHCELDVQHVLRGRWIVLRRRHTDGILEPLYFFLYGGVLIRTVLVFDRGMFAGK